MIDISQITESAGRYGKILFIRSLAVISFAVFAGLAIGQTPATKPADSGEVTVGGYRVTSTTEFGFRFRRLDGSELKYNSDLNYKQGFRVFDSSILFESDSGRGKYFDSLLITNTGWGADPSGFTRVNVEKTGIYKFNSSVRRIKYFNNLSNHVLGEHTSDTTRTFGDFDITLLPQNEKLRFNLGASFNDNNGPGVYTIRWSSDEYPVQNYTRQKSNDFRVGVEGMLLGFNLGLTQGFRIFKDRSDYTIEGPAPGNNPTNTSAIASFSRSFPTDSHAYYTHFNAHRTFAKKLDFSGQVIYTSTDSDMGMTELVVGRDNSNNYVDLDRFSIFANNKRTQARGDIGLTYMVTNNFRISNTFSFDRFSVNGGESLEQWQARRNASGTPLALVNPRSSAYRVNDYRRFVNTIEGDYQFNANVSMHIGYRYTDRKVDVTGYDVTYTNPVSATNPLIIGVDEKNSTNTLIAGMKIKPVKNWVMFWDIEHGTADNVFSRLENYKYTNVRFRTRLTVKKFAFNGSVVTKDNNNPSTSYEGSSPVLPVGTDFGTIIKNRFYAGSVEWAPMDKLTFSSGYTYHHLSSDTAIVVPITIGSTVRVLGYSLYFMRDHYGYFDVSAKPMKRMSLYASYRISRDTGQGDRYSNPLTTPQYIIGSYPMQFQSPEFRVAFRITRNVDWNVGYQYYNYSDSQTPTLNYKAHLPYTSLKIYFGGGSADR